MHPSPSNLRLNSIYGHISENYLKIRASYSSININVFILILIKFEDNTNIFLNYFQLKYEIQTITLKYKQDPWRNFIRNKHFPFH